MPFVDGCDLVVVVTDANGPRLREKAGVTGNVTVVWLGRMPESDAIGGVWNEIVVRDYVSPWWTTTAVRPT